LELGRKAGNYSMDDAHKITDISVSTISTTPLRGTIEIDTPRFHY